MVGVESARDHAGPPEEIGLEHLARDPLLAARLDRYGPPQPTRRTPGFPTLVRIVVEQSISLDAARAISDRIEANRGLDAEALARIEPEALREAGLTAAKARCICELARAVATGRFDLNGLAAQDDTSVRRALEAHYGIGPWTSQVYLMMALDRPDVWPDGDIALQRELARDGLDLRADRLARAERWAPFRSLAAHVLWHAYLTRLGR